MHIFTFNYSVDVKTERILSVFVVVVVVGMKKILSAPPSITCL